MSPLPARMATTRDKLKHAVTEFIKCWEVQGEATLFLTTKGGNTTLNFTTSLGPPDTPLQPPVPAPGSTNRRRRRRGPARRERDRARAASYQATLTQSTPHHTPTPTPSEPGEEGESSAVPVEEVASHPTGRTCKRCGRPCLGHPAPGYGLERCQVTLAASPSSPPSREVLRDTVASMVDLTATPGMEKRKEPCFNCGEPSSPTHQCLERKEEEEEKEEDKPPTLPPHQCGLRCQMLKRGCSFRSREDRV